MPEIDELTRNGWVSRSPDVPIGFKISQEALLWWLSNELIRTIRDDNNFEEWLLGKKLVGGIFTQKELEHLRQTTKYLTSLLQKGVSTLVEAYVNKLIGVS